jgi:hypothetical protein
MSLASSLVAIGDGTLPESFEGLKSNFDPEWIESALKRTGNATMRRRKLPADQVIWLVIGMALFRNQPIDEVVRALELVLPEDGGNAGRVTKGAIPQARDRVGADPLRELFFCTARHWALTSADKHRWRGLMVLGIDGTSLRVPDSLENRETFQLPRSARAGTCSYPLVRVVGLMALRSHLLLDFDFAPGDTNELTLARPMLERTPADSLLIVDRGFAYHSIFQLLSQGQRHWLSRARSEHRWSVVKKFREGDELVEMQVSDSHRQKCPQLPSSYLARAIRYQREGFRPQVLLTSLVDPKRYPAAEVIELYHERWEIELGYRELKTHTLEQLESIRSRTPERVRQEIWGLAVAYNLIRREMEAVGARLRLPPTRISFRGALRAIRYALGWIAFASPGAIPKRVRQMRLELAQLVLPERRPERSYPRVVKIKMSNYGRKSSHALN